MDASEKLIDTLRNDLLKDNIPTDKVPIIVFGPDESDLLPDTASSGSNARSSGRVNAKAIEYLDLRSLPKDVSEKLIVFLKYLVKSAGNENNEKR